MRSTNRTAVFRMLAIAAIACAAACGGASSSAGTATISAPIGGVTLSVVDVETVSLTSPLCGQQPPLYFVEVVISNHAGVCAAAESGAFAAGSTRLLLDIFSSAAAIQPGTWSTPNGSNDPFVSATFEKYTNCSSSPYTATSGTVTLSSIQGHAVAGSFDLTFNDAASSHVTGTFSSPGCAIADAKLCDFGSIAGTTCE